MGELLGILFLVFILALFVGGIGCGLCLFFPWLKYQTAEKHHAAWKRVWGGGWLLSIFALGTLLFPATRAGWPLVSLVSLPLWVEAYILFRRAKAQDTIPLPRYDDPQEGVWPPPPANPL